MAGPTERERRGWPARRGLPTREVASRSPTPAGPSHTASQATKAVTSSNVGVPAPEPTPVPRNRRRQACRPTSDWETPRYSPFILPCTPSPAIGRCGPSRCPARGEHLRFSRLCQEISAESRQSLQAVASPSEQCDHLLVDQRHTDRHPSSSGRGWSESAWHSPQQPEFRRRGITSGLGYHRKPESRP